MTDLTVSREEVDAYVARRKAEQERLEKQKKQEDATKANQQQLEQQAKSFNAFFSHKR